MRLRPLSLLLLAALVFPAWADSRDKYDCETVEDWKLGRTDQKPVDSASVSQAGNSIRYDYARDDPTVLAHVVPMQGFRELRIALRSEATIPLAILVKDRDGALFMHVAPVPARLWSEVRVTPEDFEPHAKSPKKKDRLDPELLGEGYLLADTTSWFEPGKAHGKNAILVDTVWVKRRVAEPERGRPAPDRATVASVPRHAWERDPGNPRLTPSFDVAPGAPPARAVSAPSVAWDEADRTWKMWFAVHWKEGEAVRAGVKYAESRDGIRWTVGDPLAFAPATDADAWDHTGVDSPCVLIQPDAPADRRYLLYYAGANWRNRGSGPSLPRIGVAFSASGRRFTRMPAEESSQGMAGLLLAPQDLAPAGSVALSDPEVVRSDTGFHLWYTVFRGSPGEAEERGIGHAVSDDGLRWEQATGPLASLAVAGKTEHPRHPAVVWNATEKRFEMWFSGGRAEAPGAGYSGPTHWIDTTVGWWCALSMDGVEWTVQEPERRDFEHDPRAAGEAENLLAGADVVLHEGEYFFYYAAVNGKATEGVRQGDPLSGILVARGK